MGRRDGDRGCEQTPECRVDEFPGGNPAARVHGGEKEENADDREPDHQDRPDGEAIPETRPPEARGVPRMRRLDCLAPNLE